VKPGRRIVYRREDLDEWLTERRRNATSDLGSDDLGAFPKPPLVITR
jgi:hypothetical protein